MEFVEELVGENTENLLLAMCKIRVYYLMEEGDRLSGLRDVPFSGRVLS
jgi:hypothetical protein